MAATTSSSTVKSSWLIKRAARIIRNGSSLNESVAFPGVRNTRFAKSETPSKGSINSGVGVVSSSAIELTVKSRRPRSPIIESPKSTSGLRDDGS